MASHTQRVGLFTAENITCVLRAIPGSNGTYAEIARNAQERGATVSPYTISSWVNRGRADLQTKKRNTAYERFAKRYDELLAEHCGPEANRQREFDGALEILDGTCECGNDKMVMPDGSRDNTCRECQEIDDQGRRSRPTR